MPLRPDVEAAIRAALEDRLDEIRPDYPDHIRQKVVRLSLQDDAAGVQRSTILKALELVLDQVAAAFPVTADPEGFTCPECSQPPKVGSRTAHGLEMTWMCPNGHRWETHLDQPMPTPGAPVELPKTAGQELDYFDALVWIQTAEWALDGHTCADCGGFTAERAMETGLDPHLAGHRLGCKIPAVVRCFGGRPLLAPVPDEVH